MSEDPSPELVAKIIEQTRTELAQTVIHEGVAVYWQHDPRRVGAVIHQGQPWAYTVGRTMDGRPELLVTGLGEAHSRNVLTELRDLDCDPDHPRATTSVGRVAFIAAETGLLHAAFALFGLDYSALQVIHDGDPQPLHPAGGLILTDPYPEEW